MSGVVSPVVTCSSEVVTPKRADARRRMAGHPPELAHQLDVRGLAVGAGDRDDRVREGREEFGGEPRELAARLGVGDMDRAGDRRLAAATTTATAPDETASANEILAVEPFAPEGAEDRARRDLAVIDREAGDGGGFAAAGQRAQVHQCPAAAAATGGMSSDSRDVAVEVGDDAEQRAGARDHPRRRPARRSRRRWSRPNWRRFRRGASIITSTT